MIRKTHSFDLSDWPLIAFGGPDRAKSLQNLTTQDIKGLPVGAVAEGFVTSPQGKTIGFFTFFVRDDAILLRPGANRWRSSISESTRSSTRPVSKSSPTRTNSGSGWEAMRSKRLRKRR